eukprot:scaffold12984_cov58-Attheya_sp.AAC.6
MKEIGESSSGLVISRARNDLKDVNVEGVLEQLFVAWWFNPLRHFILDPAFRVAESAVPNIVSVVPFLEPIAVTGLGVAFEVIRWSHCVVSSVEQSMCPILTKANGHGTVAPLRISDHLDETNDLTQAFDLHVVFRQEFEIVTNNQDINIVTAMTNASKIVHLVMGAYLWRWARALEHFCSFAKLLGIYQHGTALKPPGIFGSTGVDHQNWYDPKKLMDAVTLGRYQQAAEARNCNNSFLACDENAISFHDAKRYMKFASAAYRIRGSMLERELSSMEPIPENCDNAHDVPASSTTTFLGQFLDVLDERRTLAKHMGLSSQHIWIGRVRESKNPPAAVLPYFIAVDRENRAIVLTMRGSWNVTHSIPNFSSKCGKELYVRTYMYQYCFPDDLKFVVSFCGGRAHGGMVTIANAMWNAVHVSILRRLKQHPTYELIFVGHGLAGGVACLLTIRWYHETCMERTRVRCHAFGPPPVFTSSHTSVALNEAFLYTTVYIHSNDVVPFASANAIDRLRKGLDAVGDHVDEEIDIFARVQEITGLGRGYNAELAQKLNDLGVEPGSRSDHELLIPASNVVWMRRLAGESLLGHGEECQVFYLAEFPQPHDLAARGILLSTDMVTDHFPSEYEKALLYFAGEERIDFLPDDS